MTSRDRDSGRKYESGSSKRKKCAERKGLINQLSGSMSKFLKTAESPVIHPKKDSDMCLSSGDENQPGSSLEYKGLSPFVPASTCSQLVLEPEHHPPTTSCEHPPPPSPFPCAPLPPPSPERPSSDSSEHSPPPQSSPDSPCPMVITEVLDTNPKTVSDPYLWSTSLNQTEIDRIVEAGPKQLTSKSFPKNGSGRHFSNKHYTRILPNGEELIRRWLIYSESKDAVFCFACRLFSSGTALSSSDGMDDWKHLSEALGHHERSKTHNKCMEKWIILEKGLKSGKTIDSISQKRIIEEKQRWRDILERLLAIVQFLASHNLAFRGHREILAQNTSGNFLDLVKLIAKFDPTLKLHLSNVMDKDKTVLRNHYLSKDVQNELILLMASRVKHRIIEDIKANKYYSIILDCIRDISRVEQLSIILRTTDKNTAEISEHFVGFVSVESTTAEKLTDYVLYELDQLGLSLDNCRGQSYDNGANMRGEKSGVQRRLLNMNPLALFVPCGSHSWNLVLGDAAASCSKAQSFFGLLQRLYTIFAYSSDRWATLKDHVDISLKPLSETRWECRVESVKAVKYQLNEVCDALSSVREKSTDCSLVSECLTLENEIMTYEFITSLVIWYDILVKIHCISKIWQSPEMHLDVALSHIEAFIKWLKEYRNSGFVGALVTAREIAENAGVSDLNFKAVRLRRKSKMFSYETRDDVPDLSPQENYRITYFNVIVDTIQMSCQKRFEALKQHEQVFGFLYRIKDLTSIAEGDILKSCKNLQTALTLGQKSDIDGLEMFEELGMFIEVYKGDNKIASVLKYIVENALSDIYPNLSIALRILTTIPVTVAAAERSFSKLKLIKTYLRNTMTQDRLSALALLSIENEIASLLDFNDVIENFSKRKSRRVHF